MRYHLACGAILFSQPLRGIVVPLLRCGELYLFPRHRVERGRRRGSTTQGLCSVLSSQCWIETRLYELAESGPLTFQESATGPTHSSPWRCGGGDPVTSVAPQLTHSLVISCLQ